MERGGGGGEGIWWCVGEEGKKWEREKKVVEGGNMKRISGKLRGKNEIRTVHYLGRRYVGIFGRSSAKAKEDPGKMMKPVRGGGTGTKGVF